MKKLAFLVATAIVCASTSVLADVEGDNVFGIMAVESGTEYTIVAVPWCECSTNNNQAVSVSNIVKTANLEANDMVYVVDNTGKFNAWKLQNGADDVLYWHSVPSVTLEGLGTLDSSVATVGRGSAIILYRQNPKDGGSPKKFYLYGQVGTTNQVETVIAASSDGVHEAKTLIAPPRYNAGGFDILDDSVASFTPAEGDKIVVRKLVNGSSIEYVRQSSGWVTKLPPTYNVDSASRIDVPAGAGAWYVTTSTETGRKITWKNVPAK